MGVGGSTFQVLLHQQQYSVHAIPGTSLVAPQSLAHNNLSRTPAIFLTKCTYIFGIHYVNRSMDHEPTGAATA